MKSYLDFDLREYNGYKIKATCRRAMFPEVEGDLLDAYSANSGKGTIILGNGNNVILSKEYYDQDFIIFNGCFDQVEVNSTEIVAEAGVTLLRLSQIAMEHSLTGLEIFYDIPGSVGGAVAMNAGTKDIEIKDVLRKVRYFDFMDMKIKEISSEDINFEYRNSFFLRNPDKIVLKAWFQLEHGNKQTIINKMEENKKIRWAKQPREYPSCGSVFKRPQGRFVGPMIDELGMKGFTVGGAQISEKHSGFIINIGNATGNEILVVISEVQKRVKDKYGIDLELEQRII